MGPRETPPPLPDIEPDMVEAEAAQVWTALRECNWVVAMPSAALLKATLAPGGAGAFPAGDSKSVDGVGLKLIPALDPLNRSPSPCPTNRNKYRQPVFLVEFNSTPSMQTLTTFEANVAKTGSIAWLKAA